MSRPGSCAALALLAAGCAASSSEQSLHPWMSYECTVSLAAEHGEFHAGTDSYSWTYDAAEGLEIVVKTDFPRAARFVGTGFSDETQPTLAIWISRRFDTRTEKLGPPALSVDVRIGERALRTASSGSFSATFAYEEWRELLAEAGDMRVALIDDRNGAVLQSGLIPRSVLDSVEPTMEDAATELVDKTNHPEGRCALIDERVIVI